MSNPLSLEGPWTLVAEGYQAETVSGFREYLVKNLPQLLATLHSRAFIGVGAKSN